MGIGVSDHHIAPLQKVAAKNDFFLFIRPTEDDSLRLIDAGYATKSMDIHDKSSNWGPMAGFVPCDKAFCKRPEGAKPNADLSPHSHGLAHPVQLTLDRQVISQFEGTKMIRVPKTDAAVFTETNDRSTRGIPAVFRTGHQMRHRELESMFPLYKPLGAPPGRYQDIYFCIDAWQGVWWVDFGATQASAPRSGPGIGRRALPGLGASGGSTGEGDRKVTLRPLWVWAYDVAGGRKPVTGDYDIWALIPHVTGLRGYADHGLVAIDRKEHGDSAASEYYKSIATQLNEACGRTDNPVFNHGAEAQNFGFTQKHDPDILMIPPGGGPSRVRKISIAEMPRVLAEIEHAGYLVLLNRQWTVDRPKLMGMKLPGVLKLFAGIDQALLKQARSRLGNAQGPQRGVEARKMWKTAGSAIINENRHEASARFDPDRAAMSRWYKELAELLPLLGEPLKVLSSQDFPREYQQVQANIHDIQRKLEALSTQHMTGGGQSDDAMVGLLEACEDDFRAIVEYWKTPA